MIVHAFSQSQKYNRKSKKWQKLTNVMTRCITKDMLPMAIVEKSGFKKMLETFDPRYQLPSRKYVSQDIIVQQHSGFCHFYATKCKSFLQYH